MIKFENVLVYGFEAAFRGMRNPMESWALSDTPSFSHSPLFKEGKIIPEELGEADISLARRLIIGGTEHRKFLRQIVVWVDITAPLYFFKEFDTYTMGKTSNSTSTMHKLASTPITRECFSFDWENDLKFEVEDLGLRCSESRSMIISIEQEIQSIINVCESLRRKFLETKDKRYWRALIQMLPEGWNQKRTITLSYETVLKMLLERESHKMSEWSGKDKYYDGESFVEFADSLPLSKVLFGR